MAIWGHGLRAKSIMALLIACLVALLPSGLIGWQVLGAVQDHFGKAYARNFTLLSRQQILAPVSRELALAQRLAGSVITRSWLRDEANTDKTALFFEEAQGYADDFRSHSYFIASARSNQYYFNDPDKVFSTAPRYQLDPDKTDDAWFFNSMAGKAPYNINVNPDTQLGLTRVWINVLIRDGEQPLGMAGTGMDLSAFIDQFIRTDEPGVTPIIIDKQGAIQAHPDTSVIAFGATTGAELQGHHLFAMVGPQQDQSRLRLALARAERSPEQVILEWVTLNGHRQLLALAYIPELQWYVVTAVDVAVANILERPWLHKALFVLMLMLALLVLALVYAVDKLLLSPLQRLQGSASAIAEGRFDVSLPPPSKDEIGDLSQAFGVMAEKIKQHRTELEDKIVARTRELEKSHRQINDSIDYASLLQRAILPDRQLTQVLGESHFVIWRPRDVVGGDFYLFQQDGDRFLLGLVDCAGHGVPGALMTMLARAALDHAITQSGIRSPAAVLKQADLTLRGMLQDCELPRSLATNMDAALAFIDPEQQRLVFAGAKMSLYWSDGRQVEEIKGNRRPLVGRHSGDYQDVSLDFRPERIYYLTTDGYLDQAGGDKGFGLGNTRFHQLLKEHAAKPLAEQADALTQALDEYSGDYPQRDDITLLAFRAE
ncbi:biofilm regulation protein phosphatase SiaA [Zobellella maritima]|uniref:biofilm regulation protein phosphatase SiaA n=1 Tax=Zobellella maritima TaxID=2059725 RepID=UPI000E305850|nr:biofilm regulation protein phosphatase SiaA [Zobellella maritima]